MGKKEGFEVEIWSDFEEFWCYNIMVTCGCFDENGGRVGFASADDSVAPVGANLAKRPSDYPSKRMVKFDTEECDHLLMYIYVIPHTIPIDRAIDEHKPFMLNVRITRGGRLVVSRNLQVNRWSGASLEVRSNHE
ncbi:MAG: hypothetical protein IJF63_06300 [Alistipes sp.]|nr:hypothetical protein [Alistipes sp.]